MADSTEAPRPDDVHTTTEAAETTLTPATTTPEAGTETTAMATATSAPASDHDGALVRARRSSAPSPESQVEAIEQRRADLSRDTRRSPFDEGRPYHNTSLENADVDPEVGWNGRETDRSRIFGPRDRTSNTLRFGADEEENDDDGDNHDEISIEVEVTAEAQWALETAGMIPMLSEYSNSDDDYDC